MPKLRSKTAEYYWVWCVFENRLVILGPHNSEQEANEVGYSEIPVPFSVEKLETRSKPRAFSIIKRKYLGETKDLHGALQNSMHEKGLAKYVARTKEAR